MTGSQFNGQYNGLNFGSAGVALTYAGFTVGGNVGRRLHATASLAYSRGTVHRYSATWSVRGT